MDHILTQLSTQNATSLSRFDGIPSITHHSPNYFLNFFSPFGDRGSIDQLTRGLQGVKFTYCFL